MDAEEEDILSDNLEVRDIRKGNWAWFNKVVFEDNELPPSVKYIYLLLTYFVKTPNARVKPSITRLAQASKMKEETVYKAITLLEEKEYIKVRRITGMINIYILLDLDRKSKEVSKRNEVVQPPALEEVVGKDEKRPPALEEVVPPTQEEGVRAGIYNVFKTNKLKESINTHDKTMSINTASHVVPRVRGLSLFERADFKDKTKLAEMKANDLLHYFCLKYKEMVGAPYVVNYGKDNRLIKEIMTVYDADHLVDIIDVFFRNRNGKEWWSGKWEVGVLKGAVNDIVRTLMEKSKK